MDIMFKGYLYVLSYVIGINVCLRCFLWMLLHDDEDMYR